MYEFGKEEIDALIKVIESKQFMRYRGGEGGFTEQFECSFKENLKLSMLNPHQWTKREIEYTKDMCPITLDVLKRTCRIAYDYNTPLAEVEERCLGMID